MINDIVLFVDGAAAGVMAMAFADAHRHHREVVRAEKTLADARARLEAADARADAALAKAERGRG